MSKGYWEQKNRNPLIGAVVFVIIIGALYFMIQAVVMNAYILIDMARSRNLATAGAGGYMERMKALYQFYQKPILWIVMLSQFVIFLVPTILVYKHWHNSDWVGRFQLRGVSPLAILVAIGGTLLFIPLADFLGSLFFRLFPGMEEWSSLQAPLFEAGKPGDLLFLIMVIGVTPAICEELLFRGYFQSVLTQKYRDGRVILFSGFLFALYHQNPMGLFALAAAGVWLGLLSWGFRSLYPSMAAHFVYNSVIILMVNGKIGSSLLNEQGSFHWMVTLGSTLLFLALAWWIWPKSGDKGSPLQIQ